MKFAHAHNVASFSAEARPRARPAHAHSSARRSDDHKVARRSVRQHFYHLFAFKVDVTYFLSSTLFSLLRSSAIFYYSHFFRWLFLSLAVRHGRTSGMYAHCTGKHQFIWKIMKFASRCEPETITEIITVIMIISRPWPALCHFASVAIFLIRADGLIRA